MKTICMIGTCNICLGNKFVIHLTFLVLSVRAKRKDVNENFHLLAKICPHDSHCVLNIKYYIIYSMLLLTPRISER